jgi:hypothetical protein
MRKKTIMKVVILTATILTLTGCNSSTGANTTTTEPVTTTSSVETSTERETETSSNQETETSSTVASAEQETSTSALATSEPTIPETTVEIETTTQDAGYDGICEEYGHVVNEDGIEYFLLDEGAPMVAWKDAVSKHKWVSNDSSLFYTTAQYKGHTVLVPEPGQGYGDEDMDAEAGSDVCMGVVDPDYFNGEMTLSPFIYDIDLNFICPSSDSTWITDQEVRDGVTWYKYHLADGYDYWLPEHNGADWEQVYKKYVEEPYNAKYNSMSDEEKVNEMLMAYEQVWNKTYYNVVTEGLGGTVHVTKCYAYKNADGSITQSAGWEWCASSIFNGTSLPEHGSIKDRDDGVTAYWKYDGNTLIDNTEYNALASELYYHLIDLYGEECVRWNDDNIWNGETLDGFHDWDVYGDGNDACRSREEHIAKCQGN